MAPFDFKSDKHFVAPSSDGTGALQVLELTKSTLLLNPSSIRKAHWRVVATIDADQLDADNDEVDDDDDDVATETYDGLRFFDGHGEIEGRTALTKLAQHLARLRLMVSPSGYCFQVVNDHELGGDYVDFGIHYLRLNDLFSWSHHGVRPARITTWGRSELKYRDPRLEKASKQPVGVSKEKYEELKRLVKEKDEELKNIKKETDGELLKLREEMEEEFLKLKEEKDDELDKLREEVIEAHEAKDDELQKLRKEKDEELQRLRKAKIEELQKLRKEKDEELRKLSKKHDDELQMLKKGKDGGALLQKLRKEKDEALQKFKDEMEEEKEKLRKEKDDELEKLENEKEEEMFKRLEEKDDELQKLKKEKDEELRRALKTKDEELEKLREKKDGQAAGSQGSARKENDEQLQNLRQEKDEELRQKLEKKDEELEKLREEKDAELGTLRTQLSSRVAELEQRRNSWALLPSHRLLTSGDSASIERIRYLSKRYRMPPGTFKDEVMINSFYTLYDGSQGLAYQKISVLNEDTVTFLPHTIYMHPPELYLDEDNWWCVKTTHPNGNLTMLAYYDGNRRQLGPYKIPIPFDQSTSYFWSTREFFFADFGLGYRFACTYREY